MALKMRRRLAAAFATLALVGAGVSAGFPGVGVHTASAKPCSSGWKHAVIGGEHKCLRRGQFCARRYDSQYHRYGYHCHKRDYRGNYHLT
jgi:hypothetical protein